LSTTPQNTPKRPANPAGRSPEKLRKSLAGGQQAFRLHAQGMKQDEIAQIQNVPSRPSAGGLADAEWMAAHWPNRPGE